MLLVYNFSLTFIFYRILKREKFFTEVKRQERFEKPFLKVSSFFLQRFETIFEWCKNKNYCLLILFNLRQFSEMFSPPILFFLWKHFNTTLTHALKLFFGKKKCDKMWTAREIQDRKITPSMGCTYTWEYKMGATLFRANMDIKFPYRYTWVQMMQVAC